MSGRVKIKYDEICPFRTNNKAVFIEIGKTSVERNQNGHFLPLSLCKVDREKKIVTAPAWLAKKKGLI